MRKTITSLLLAAGLAFTAASVLSAAETDAAAQQPAAPIVNPMDPSTWMGGFPTTGTAAPNATIPGQTLAFNPAHPAGWAAFIDPSTHEQTHAAFMNPAQYAQFMSPQFYMQFMDPNNMMAWMNPASYATFMNPATYMYWMNPGTYTHMMNPAMYMQGMNPASYATYMNPNTYMQWMNPAAYTVPGATTASATPFNMFVPNAAVPAQGVQQ